MVRVSLDIRCVQSQLIELQRSLGAQVVVSDPAGDNPVIAKQARDVGKALLQPEKWRLQELVGERCKTDSERKTKAPEDYELPCVPGVASEKMCGQVETQRVKDV